MSDDYLAGIALIVEGPTEEELYRQFLIWACHRHPGSYFHQDRDRGEVCYVMTHAMSDGTQHVLVKFHSANTISRIPQAQAWFLQSCVGRHPSVSWHVFLAYDTDGHTNPVSQAKEGDWPELRAALSVSAESVTDLAADTDIEDVMLLDPAGVLRFLGLPTDTPIPSGGKGKSKMKRLFRAADIRRAYHEGSKALPLIKALDIGLVFERAGMPIDRLEAEAFPWDAKKA